MGNALRSFFGQCCWPTTSSDGHPLGPHGISKATVGVSALARDLLHFEITSQVPQGLNKHVLSSRRAQANWYRKILQAWKDTKSPPITPEEAVKLIIQTLKTHKKADVEGLLAFYGLPLPASQPEVTMFELHTLPVDARSVCDGDTISVFVSTNSSREASLVPKDIKMLAVKRSKAQSKKKFMKADEFHKKIIDSGYRVLNIQNKEILAHKYKIRLRGIDAPESLMPYGKEARDELTKIVQGKCLRILIYDQDHYGRFIGDIYCNGKFVQESMLKKGLAWHYTTYDQRVELAQWEKKARVKRVGLWALSNPEEPWEWRKNRRGDRKKFAYI